MKKRYITIFSILVLCACSLFFGVWAARIANINSNGSISFTASGVNCRVSGQIQNSTASVKTLSPLTFTASDNTDVKSWGTANAIAFDNNESPINIVITVENLVDRLLYAKVTDAVFGEESQFSVKTTPELLTLNGRGTGTITINITPKPMDNSVEADYSFNVILSATMPKVFVDVSNYTNTLTFTELSGQTVEGYQAVSVKQKAKLTSGTYDLPGYILLNGKKCVLTTIEEKGFYGSTGYFMRLPDTITQIGAFAFAHPADHSSTVAMNTLHIYSENCEKDGSIFDFYYGKVYFHTSLKLISYKTELYNSVVYMEEGYNASWLRTMFGTDGTLVTESGINYRQFQ